MIKILRKDELKAEVAVVIGTRPGIIKFSPVIRELQDGSVPFYLIHTGQHYSYNMDKQFIEDLGIPVPRYSNDEVRKSVFHGAQTAEMIRGLESALLDAKPMVVIVGGDANTNLAGALAARKLGLTLFHMEAGLRSNDWRMPEEHNRVMIDHISDVLLAPTEGARENLIKDNVKGEIVVVGNTIVDAVYQNIDIANKKSKVMVDLSIEKDKYFLLTLHREENVDNEEILKKLIGNVKAVINAYAYEVIFPIHPRTIRRLQQFEFWEALNAIEGLRIVDAVGYLDFLLLIQHARIILTDSGGVQEEACILKVPCVTLRGNTERPETVAVGANKVVGTDLYATNKAIQFYLEAGTRRWSNPFGDGSASRRIVSKLKEKLSW